MQKNLARQHKLPTENQVKDMQSDLKFKQGQLDDSETTAARLKVQKEQVQSDLEKVKNLEGRIHKEMQQARDKILSMDDDMTTKFPMVNQLKQQADEERQRM